jgi:hypothetical protein
VLPENRRMEFRIGINLWDVIEKGDSIYGDGVNITGRLEGLADAGGICISESAYQQIENKLPLRYDYLGEHEVKNIARPVRVYRARIEPEVAPSKLGEEKKPVWKRLTDSFRTARRAQKPRASRLRSNASHRCASARTECRATGSGAWIWPKRCTTRRLKETDRFVRKRAGAQAASKTDAAAGVPLTTFEGH